MKYKSFREKKARDEQRAFEDIRGIFTFLAYILRFRLKEVLILLVIVLLAIICLQFLGFNFSIIRGK
jgi:hypothetical protein